MSESDPIDLSNLQSLQFRPSWAEDLAKSDTSAGEVIWGRAPGGPPRDDRQRPGGPPRRDGGRGFDRDNRGGPRPERRGPGGPRPDFRGGPPAQGERRPPPRHDGPGQGPPRPERREGGPDSRGPRPERRDFGGPRRDDRGPQGQGGRPPFRGGDRRDFRGPQEHREMPPPLMGWSVSLIPDHRSVEAIARQIKASGRAFSVFDVGRLFMESRERYQVCFTRRQSAPQKGPDGQPLPEPSPREQGPPELIQCVADGSLWLNRDEAIRHLLNSPALTKYYRTETVTLDAPKGNFTAIAVCGFSGTLLGPPNHHDFQRNVARLHRERFSDMPLERLKSRIRTEKDEALILKWQESLTSATQYVPVSEEPPPEGVEPPPALKTVAEMEAHFLRTHAPAAARAVTKAVVPGTIAGKNLSPPLLGLLRTEVERQQRFPMQLVQDLCRDLESQGLRFFKRDKKTTFVCRNRPHFLPDDMVLSDRIRSMVEMVRANPGITYSRLVSTLAPHIVAFVPPPAAAPEPAASAPESAAEAPAPADEAPTLEVVAEATGEAAVINAAPPAVAEPAADTVTAPEDGASPPPAEAVPVETPAESAAPVEAEPKPLIAPESKAPGAPAPQAAPPAPPAPTHLSPEEIAILQDLHWLVQEGYVTEFQNGELFVLGRPPQPPAEKRPRPQRPPQTSPASSEPVSGEAAPPVEGEASAPAGEPDLLPETPSAEEAPVAASSPEPETIPQTPAIEESPSGAPPSEEAVPVQNPVSSPAA